jgi:hypothetical protein
VTRSGGLGDFAVQSKHVGDPEPSKNRSYPQPRKNMSYPPLVGAGLLPYLDVRNMYFSSLFS